MTLTSNPSTPPTPAVSGRPPFWERLVDDSGGWRKGQRVDGRDLAALRRGTGQAPGAVPQLWPYYTTLNAHGRLTDRLYAEHLALTLFGLHQQSRPTPMHRRGIGFGSALHSLRQSEKFSNEAVDRRVSAAATAASLAQAAVHARSLVTQLKGISQPLDYTQLMLDFTGWSDPDRRAGVLRRWGSAYFLGRTSDDE